MQEFQFPRNTKRFHFKIVSKVIISKNVKIGFAGFEICMDDLAPVQFK